MENKRELSSWTVAATLVSVHYGLGFLLGTGEKVFLQGTTGTLYAVSTAIGLFALVILVRFYWKAVDPIWILLGKQYGKEVQVLVGLMSWSWMLGAVSAQTLGSVYILRTIGIQSSFSVFLIIFLIIAISLIPIEKIGSILKVLLVISTIALLVSIWLVDGFPVYIDSFRGFVPSLKNQEPVNVLGVILSTTLLTMLGMDFQQFIVRAQSVKSAYLGCILGGLILFILAFLPTTIVLSSIQSGILPVGINAEEVIPFTLLWTGNSIFQPLGIILLSTLLIVAFGSAGCVLRIMNSTLKDQLEIMNIKSNQKSTAVLNGLLVLLITLTGDFIIDLIVNFYAIYVGSVLVPFVAYILEIKRIISFKKRQIFVSLLLGSMFSVIALISSYTYERVELWGNSELFILFSGILASFLGLQLLNITNLAFLKSKA